jgi:hypothetical protein
MDDFHASSMLLPCFFHVHLFSLPADTTTTITTTYTTIYTTTTIPTRFNCPFGRTPFFDAICFLFTTPTLSFTIYASICSVIEISARILIVLVDLLHSAAMFVHVQWEMLLFNELFNGRGFVKNDDHTHTPGEAKTNRSDRSMCTYLSRVTDWSLRCRIRQMWG